MLIIQCGTIYVSNTEYAVLVPIINGTWLSLFTHKYCINIIHEYSFLAIKTSIVNIVSHNCAFTNVHLQQITHQQDVKANKAHNEISLGLIGFSEARVQ